MDDTYAQRSTEDTCGYTSVGQTNNTLEPLNLAFASWSWTHGVSVEAFFSLQQLLHSELAGSCHGLLRSLPGVRKHVLKFLRLTPIHTLSILLKVSKLSSNTRQTNNLNRRRTPIVAKNAKSTLYYHKIRDLIYRVLSNPSLKDSIYQERFVTLDTSSSAPWQGFAWRSSFTLSKGRNPLLIGGKVLYPGCFILFPHNVLKNETNSLKMDQLELRALSVVSSKTRIGKVCSVVRAADDERPACEVDPIIRYEELPSDLQLEARRTRTERGAVQVFLVDTEWEKPIIKVSEIHSIFAGIALYDVFLILDIRMVDIPLPSDESEKSFVVSEILYCQRIVTSIPSKHKQLYSVKCIAVEHTMRHASIRTWLFGELEVLKYGKEYLQPIFLNEPDIKIIRLGIGIYDDDFNAYRGVYHGIGGVYLGILNLDWYERKSLRNIHPLMFIPHAADQEDVYRELEKDLRSLEEHGMRVEIRGEIYHVFVKLLLQITDMPQGTSEEVFYILKER